MASVARTAITSSGADTNVYTFTAQAIGADGGNDVIYLAAGSRTIANASSATCLVDGVAADIVDTASFLESTDIRSSLVLFAINRDDLPDPSQTDIDVQITWNQNCIRASLAVLVSPDAAKVASDTAIAVGSETDVSVNTDANGIVVSACFNGDLADGNWTGLTEDSPILIEGLATFNTATASAVSVEAPRTITIADAGFGAKLAASFAAAELGIIEVVAGAAVVEGQNVDVVNRQILVVAGAAAVAGQNVDVTNPRVPVVAGAAAVEGQLVSLASSGTALDLSAAIYAALVDDSFITSRLGEYMSPSIHTRRPVPEGAGFPMIIVNPDTSIGDEDGLKSRRTVVVRDIVVYGVQDDDYRVVEEVAYYLRQKFHRERFALSVSGFHVIDIVVDGPTPAPTDDYRHVARAVSLTIRLLKT